jgi:hypothetical protein
MLINRKDSRIRGVSSWVHGKLGSLNSNRLNILRLLTLGLVSTFFVLVMALRGADISPSAENEVSVPVGSAHDLSFRDPAQNGQETESSAGSQRYRTQNANNNPHTLKGTDPRNFGTPINSVIEVAEPNAGQVGTVTSNRPGAISPAQKAKDDDLSMPEWQKIISPEGMAIDMLGWKRKFGRDGIPDYVQLYPALEAGYVEEVLSNGIATDMSALLMARDVQDEVLYNGAVSAAHDLGNVMYMLGLSESGGLRLFVGVERLLSDYPTFIEIELNQNPVAVGSGVPWWHIEGQRQDGDLLVRFNISAGTLNSVELAVWNETYYNIFENDTEALGSGCRDRFSFAYCVGTPPIDRSQQVIELWDEESQPVEPVRANGFVEIALDFARLLDSASEFSSLYIRTPEDVVLTSFHNVGQASHLRPMGFATGAGTK